MNKILSLILLVSMTSLIGCAAVDSTKPFDDQQAAVVANKIGPKAAK